MTRRMLDEEYSGQVNGSPERDLYYMPKDDRRVSYPAAYSILNFDELTAATVDETTPSPEDVAIAHEMERSMRSSLEGRELRVFDLMLRSASLAEMAAIEEVSLRQMSRIVAEVRRKAAAAIGRIA